MATARKIPFSFILDHLSRIDFIVKPLFGSHAIYFRDKILFALRQQKDHEEANGIWIATSKEHHASLKKEFPSMTSIYILSGGKGETGWQMIPENADDFESSAVHLCELILKGDERIGKIPKNKSKGKKVARGNRKK